MAPNSKSLSNLQPSSKNKEEIMRPSSSEEEEEYEEHNLEEEEEEKEEENSSGEEEEDPSELEEDNDDDNDEEQEKVTESTQILSPKSVPQPKGSDSELESDESPSAYKMEPVPKTSITKGKRAHDENDSGQASPKSKKKIKTDEKKAVPSSTPSSGGFMKLWCDADEDTLLKGLVEFKNLNTGDINGAFYDNIKGKLQVDFSKDQLRSKISGLRKRFFNAMKRTPDGVDPVFSKPRDVMIFELSKKIWRADGKFKGYKNDDVEGVHEKSKKEPAKGVKKETGKCRKDDEESIMWSKYPFLSSSFDDVEKKLPSLGMSGAVMSFVKEKLSLLGNSAAEELNEKWKQMFVQEFELHYKMLTLMKEQIKLAMDQ